MSIRDWAILITGALLLSVAAFLGAFEFEGDDE